MYKLLENLLGMNTARGELPKKNCFFYIEEKYSNQIAAVLAYYIELLHQERKDLGAYGDALEAAGAANKEKVAEVKNELARMEQEIAALAAKQHTLPSALFEQMKEARPSSGDTVSKSYPTRVERIYNLEKTELAKPINQTLGRVFQLVNKEEPAPPELRQARENLSQKTLYRIACVRNVDELTKDRPEINLSPASQSMTVLPDRLEGPPSRPKTIAFHALLVAVPAALFHLVYLYSLLHLRLLVVRLARGKASDRVSRWVSLAASLPIIGSLLLTTIMGTMLCNRQLYLKSSPVVSLAVTLAELGLFGGALWAGYYLLRGWVQSASAASAGPVAALAVYLLTAAGMGLLRSVYARSTEGVRYVAYYLIAGTKHLCLLAVVVLLLLAVSAGWCTVYVYLFKGPNQLFAAIGDAFAALG